MEQTGTTFLTKCGSSILLVLASAVSYMVLFWCVAHIYDHNVRLVHEYFLILAAMLFWGGARLWRAWRIVVGCTWLFFCPLAVVNSFVYRGFKSDPLMQANESRLRFLTAASRAALMMAAVSLLIGIALIALHRRRMRTELSDAEHAL